uniref:Cytochrome c oxidase assembly factor 5 n=1 Tax=Rhipicephalus zambeziensis TaxID=60191 RepID=A0A224YUD2_9ACAR
MPIYTEEDSALAPHKACEGVRDDLKRCLLATDCVRKEKLTPKECLRANHPSIPTECHNLKQLFFECKRSMLDNRQRFRGRKGY